MDAYTKAESIDPDVETDEERWFDSRYTGYAVMYAQAGEGTLEPVNAY